MTERLSDVEARIGSVHQLAAVVTAMRGIAAARSREARHHIDGIRAYSAAIATAIGEALALLPAASPAPIAETASSGHAIVALCAEQGFAGAFNEHVLDAIAQLAGAEPEHRVELLLVGDRGLMIANARSVTVDWSAAMIMHVAQMEDLANRIVEALYDRLQSGRIGYVTIVHAAPETSDGFRVFSKRLVPFDYARFQLVRKDTPPLITLPPQLLVTRLTEEYIFAELCEAVMLSFAAENEARTRAMIAARTNVTNTLDDLVARSRQLRQEEITNEIVELASGTQSQSGR
ncbi:F0F1 ATP synthase subunit gamma [Rhizobium jaguaris]|uniref:F0F1 ATP synthase subunit gamma n=1 Tax=Rhizobium jaguaris TaxID=1312183 RepID=A0A387G5K2_9HYPH|nr:FoF1 ATP synthase subunit gamma [Rhizobium jaguaris]AYG63554.1 hypothetical protein CCGE525_33480 [Rhizobium jaguaris]